MAETIVEKKLWDLTADSNHVKFYQWMWGIYAPDTYKTACPYYWAFFASILILPIIVLGKIAGLFLKPIGRKLSAYTIIRSNKNILVWVNRAKNATTDEEFYKIHKSKCYINNKWEIAFDDLRAKIHEGYINYINYLEKLKLERQLKMDTFKYGTGGTIIGWTVGLIILLLIGRVLYWFLHLFTLEEAFKGLLIILVAAVAVVVLFTIIYGATKVYDKYICNTWVAKFTPFKWVGQFFKAIWTGICMFFDMIKSAYNKSCPTINWK